MDNLVRELSLAAADDKTRSSEPFAALVQTVVHSFGDARNAIKRQAIAASRRGDQRTSLTLQLPLSAADAADAYLTALDEADTYSRRRAAAHPGDAAGPQAVPPLVRRGRRETAAGPGGRP